MASNTPVQPAYSFPTSRLRLRQNDPARTPLVLVACGSFSPITYLHLRMFEMAADFAKFNTEFEVLGGYFSPVGDAYKKVGLASATHRLHMCELAVNQTSNWLMVDPWEATQREYTPTALVLDHVDKELNTVLGGAVQPDGSTRKIRIILLAGADLIQTMSTPGVWSSDDLEHILGTYGTFIVERTGLNLKTSPSGDISSLTTDIDSALDSLQHWKCNIHVIQQLIPNDISSTKIRLFLRREMSVQYLIPAPVIEYVEQHGLYLEDGASPADGEKINDAAKESGKTASSSK